MRRKTSILHLVPVFLTFLSTIISFHVFSASRVLILEGSPFATEETPEATLYNLVLFLGLVLVGTIIMLIIVIFKKINFLKMFFLLGTSLMVFSIVDLYLASLEYLGVLLLDDLTYFTILFLATASSIYLIYGVENEVVPMLLTIFYTSSVGVVFAILLPFQSIILIAVVMAAYDVYSVFKGPLKKLVDTLSPGNIPVGSNGRNILRGAVATFKGLSIGAGDIIFYSMYTTLALDKGGIMASIGVILAIILGVYITLKMLEKRKAMPALPIPIALATPLIILLYCM